ncbi:hypothetical protein V493_01724 [Pseudogymnoascus sp. VKM F-4281 (FW-2241)]|nr:hypothetical protein V493_01724 [Pseudogymnoascus sp. VKM F-4281 (FW-2241)]
MAPALITEDYYMVLGVGQTAPLELVLRSYKNLALLLHPDRNTNHDATEAFQRLARAYETLKDESKRREYDAIYPTITRSNPSQTTPTPRSGALSETVQIAALQKLKEERSAQWRAKKNVFDSSIFELQRAVRQLEQEIKNLDSIVAAEAAAEAQKNSWRTWLLSPISKKAEDTEEEKERKDRERQVRQIEKDMKERRLGSKKEDLKREESLLRNAKNKVDTADRVDTSKIQGIRDIISARKRREREEKERAEREIVASIWKQEREQWEKREREAAEAWRTQQAEKRAAEDKRRHSFAAEGSTREASISTCYHEGWWSKVQGLPGLYDEGVPEM